MKFSELGLIPEILRALDESGYESPTPIQRQAIPPALSGKDVLGCAQTGTGKTAAFSLPLLQRIDEVADDEPCLRALILTPTRELAAQIGESISTYGADLGLEHAVIFGGVSDKPQISALRRGLDILVATPGRLLDLMNRGFVSLADLEVFVLDEADRMLDMGFIHDVKKIVAALPKKRQTLFFSATMPPEIRKLSEQLMDNPVHVSVTPVSSTAERIAQKVYYVEKPHKGRLLIDLLSRPEMGRTLVFSRTKHGANRIARQVDSAGIRCSAIHGNKSQGARTRALEDFRTGELSVLVATDIAARGIDIDDVTHVINFDLPNVPETYVHRIGRTARAGAEGVALSFCMQEERPYLTQIERLIKRKIDRVGTSPADDRAEVVAPPPESRRPRGDARPRRFGGGRQAARRSAN